MTPETEVISCPACRHLVRIPADWLGQPVQCPECKARFTAPIRVDGRLTDPVLTDAPQPDAAPLPPRPNRALWLPAFALMLLGMLSVTADIYSLVMLIQHRDVFVEEIARKLNVKPEDVKHMDLIIGVVIWSIFCGAVSFGGGMAIALRRGYWLAAAGSFLAMLNFANGCCVPGAFVGGWALLMLRTEDGRARFMR